MIAVQFYCVYTAPAHAIIWHTIPVTLSTLAGFWFGRRLLSPFRRADAARFSTTPSHQ